MKCVCCEDHISDEMESMQVNRDGSRAHMRCQRAYWKGHQDAARDFSPVERFYFRKFPLGSAFSLVVHSLALENGEVILRGGDAAEASGSLIEFQRVVEKWFRA